MISYQTLINEIEQLVASAKGEKDEQQIREQLSAVRALCNVALSSNKNNQSASFSHKSSATPVSNSVQQDNVVNNVSSLNGAKLKENDANGESIFDF
ncbi:YwdI family protein [Lysinibacillus sp. BW-2-10]|uniref:YwdI family protein n=1 Tax=Lysinibacillus sp. BW-2-10 TaxID=2590030 RepID=UPI00117BE54F|nr:YwdI family protein [Lysinibacillus sp. BW-2-10]TSI07484.1 hypothetical protein FJQ64_09295 [Lysinibacillus sp. BW-2-10]